MKYKILLKYFTSIRNICSTLTIREIKVCEIENESPFVKYIYIQPLKITTFTVVPTKNIILFHSGMLQLAVGTSSLVPRGRPQHVPRGKAPART